MLLQNPLRTEMQGCKDVVAERTEMQFRGSTNGRLYMCPICTEMQGLMDVEAICTVMLGLMDVVEDGLISTEMLGLMDVVA